MDLESELDLFSVKHEKFVCPIRPWDFSDLVRDHCLPGVGEAVQWGLIDSDETGKRPSEWDEDFLYNSINLFEGL